MTNLLQQLEDAEHRAAETNNHGTANHLASVRTGFINGAVTAFGARVALEAAREGDDPAPAGPEALVGRRVRWTHGDSTLVGEATRYDPDDDELFLVVDGLMHAHVWVPAEGCTAVDG
ncbi:hypothetical protein [Agromyces humi]|uniref:hypothetical protein n=1 Tax=Agromyces humi TaxID=1766800 RepID=UPI00135C4A33|nr:hypothetical protein [Agromyces humi]